MDLPIHTRTPVAIAEDTDLGASYTSDVIDIKNCVGYALQVVWAGGSTPTGNIIILASCDDEDVASRIFTPVASVPLSGNSGNYMLNVERAMYPFFRIVWDRTGGTGGTIRAKLSIKVQ